MTASHQALLMVGSGPAFSFIPGCITQIGDVTPGSAYAQFTVYPDGTLSYDIGNSNVGGPRWGNGMTAASGLWVQCKFESGTGVGPIPGPDPQALTTSRNYGLGAIAEENHHSVWRLSIANNSAMTAPLMSFTFPAFADSRSFGAAFSDAFAPYAFR